MSTCQRRLQSTSNLFTPCGSLYICRARSLVCEVLELWSISAWIVAGRGGSGIEYHTRSGPKTSRYRIRAIYDSRVNKLSARTLPYNQSHTFTQFLASLCCAKLTFSHRGSSRDIHFHNLRLHVVLLRHRCSIDGERLGRTDGGFK